MNVSKEKKEHPKEKTKLHPRNKHRERYDFKKLIATCPELAPFVSKNIYGDDSVDFFNPVAVKMLNTALLKHFYQIDNWEIPENYLCPPIPGRADYIHHVADLLGSSNFGKIPKGEQVRCLDIGVGANCIYPLIGYREYGWSFVGTDIDPLAIQSATAIIDSNPGLTGKIEVRIQRNPKDLLFGILRETEKFDLTVCNPPFYSSLQEAQEANMKKIGNLKKEKPAQAVQNFGGQNTELWYEGGEAKFVRELIRESKRFSSSCFWFTTLISKQSHLKRAYELLKLAEAAEVKTIPMGQGNKASRILAWTFLTAEQKKDWSNPKPVRS